MSIYLLTFLFMYFSGLLVFTLNRKHLLLMLLSLESCVVALYIGMCFLLGNMDFEFFFLMFFLIMSVCEGA